MRNVLLTSVAVLALTGCDANASSSLCSAPATIAALEPIIQQNLIDTVNIARSEDPYTLSMKDSDIVTVEETAHKTSCRILPYASNKAYSGTLVVAAEVGAAAGTVAASGDDWLNYEVQKSDNNDKTFVTASFNGNMPNYLAMIRGGLFVKSAAQKAADVVTAAKVEEERNRTNEAIRQGNIIRNDEANERCAEYAKDHPDMIGKCIPKGKTALDVLQGR